MKKQYIGDQVYIQKDGKYLVLTTSDAHGVNNRIYLGKSALDGLKNYVPNDVGDTCERCGCTEFLCGHNKRH